MEALEVMSLAEERGIALREVRKGYLAAAVDTFGAAFMVAAIVKEGQIKVVIKTR